MHSVKQMSPIGTGSEDNQEGVGWGSPLRIIVRGPVGFSRTRNRQIIFHVHDRIGVLIPHLTAHQPTALGGSQNIQTGLVFSHVTAAIGNDDFTRAVPIIGHSGIFMKVREAWRSSSRRIDPSAPDSIHRRVSSAYTTSGLPSASKSNTTEPVA